MSTKIKVRRDTKSNWELYNPVLDDGELCWVKDEKELKVGDGTSHFNDLDPVISAKTGYEPIYIPFEPGVHNAYFKIDGLLEKCGRKGQLPPGDLSRSTVSFKYITNGLGKNIPYLKQAGGGDLSFTTKHVAHLVVCESNENCGVKSIEVTDDSGINPNGALFACYRPPSSPYRLLPGEHYFSLIINDEGKVEGVYTRHFMSTYNSNPNSANTTYLTPVVVIYYTYFNPVDDIMLWLGASDGYSESLVVMQPLCYTGEQQY